jgi:cytochrome c-type biogenesis protein
MSPWSMTMATAVSAVPGVGITQTVLSGPFLFAAALAFAAGAVSFASPCCIPLVPGYLAYLVGLVGAEGATATGRVGVRVRTRAVRATALFVLGFTLVFLAQSVAVLGVAHALLLNATLLMRIGGAVTVVMGLVMFGFIRPLQREKKLQVRPTGRIFGALLLGGAYGLGWVVCIGPTLAGVIALATATDWGGSAWRGLFLVLFYCAGLGVPFLLMAFGFGWAGSAMTFLRRHSPTIQRAGGTMMITLGVLMLTGVWGQLIAWLQVAVSGSTKVLL